MKQSMDCLIEALETADGYRSQSLVILEYLESNGVVRKVKEESSLAAKDFAVECGQNLDNYYTVWEFLLQESGCSKYYDNQVHGSVCTKDMCCNILQAVKEGKIEVSSEGAEAFAKSFIDVIDLIFPEGQSDNLDVYIHQMEDFGGLKFDANSGKPSLYQIRKYRKGLILLLITTLFESVNMSAAINVFKKYSNKYGLRFRSIFVHVPEDLFDNKLEDLSDFDLRYLLAGIDAEQTNLHRRREAYLKTVRRLCDAGWIFESDTTRINWNLLKEISELNDTFILKGLNEEQRYYLSILAREYDEFAYKPQEFQKYDGEYKKFIDCLRQKIDQILTDRENEYEKKLLEDFNKGENRFNKIEKRKLFIDFLKACEKCQQYANYKNFSYNNIDFDALYAKVEKNEEIVKRIAVAQYRFSKIEDLDFGEGDFTNLIAVQVKVIERYLKEVIAQKMVGKTIYSQYNFKSGESKAKISHQIDKNDSAETLSSRSFSIELATAAFIAGSIGWEYCRDNEKIKNDFFTSKADGGFIAWRDSVRNGYFHIHPVENMDKAREIHYKTAFCLMKCIYLLQSLTR